MHCCHTRILLVLWRESMDWRLLLANLFPAWLLSHGWILQRELNNDFESGTSSKIINLLMSLTMLLLFLFLQNKESYYDSTWLSVPFWLSLFNWAWNMTIPSIPWKSTLVKDLLYKGQVMFLVAALPLLMIPIMEVATTHGIFSESTLCAITKLVIHWASLEFCYWFNYNIQKLWLVGLRGSKDHNGAYYLSGMLAYTSGKFFKLVLSAILLVV